MIFARKGFTLIELLYAMFIGAVLSGSIYALIMMGHKSSSGLERKVAAQQDVRAALEIMVLEIGMASYNPTWQANAWVNPGGCADLSFNQS